MIPGSRSGRMFARASPPRPADDLDSRVRTCRTPSRLKQPGLGFGVRSEEFADWPGANCKERRCAGDKLERRTQNLNFRFSPARRRLSISRPTYRYRRRAGEKQKESPVAFFLYTGHPSGITRTRPGGRATIINEIFGLSCRAPCFPTALHRTRAIRKKP